MDEGYRYLKQVERDLALVQSQLAAEKAAHAETARELDGLREALAKIANMPGPLDQDIRLRACADIASAALKEARRG